ncbi:MAG: T9SS type A sorting domain-containing protein, partial [Chitinophagaceae bacterium]
NPVINSNATIRLEKAFTQTTTLVLMDVMGRFVNQQMIPAGQTVITLDCKGLNKGMYLVKIQSRDGIVTKNFVVQ